MALVERSCSPLWRGMPVESLFESNRTTPAVHGGYCQGKQWFDRLLGGVLLLVLAPLLAILMLAVRVSSRGPAIYRQKRVGLGGRLFVIYKLRSMRMDAETVSGPRWAVIGNDPRVTPLGYWLRRLHLDELPQLINLVRGEMSFVGPRPERPEFVSVLAQQMPGYLDRLQVLPGVTGLAQVNLPPDTDLDSVRRKLVLDLAYIRTASFPLDLRLILCTALRLVGLRGGATTTWLGLHRTVSLEPRPAVSHTAIMTPGELATGACGTGACGTGRFARVVEPAAAVPDERSGVEFSDSGVVALRS